MRNTEEIWRPVEKPMPPDVKPPPGMSKGAA